MNRLVTLMMVPFFVLGQALPHSHAGTGVVVPDGHLARAHFHLFGDHHHDHNHGHHHDHDGDKHQHHKSVEQADATDANPATSATISLPTDHDSDAIYLIDADGSANRIATAPQGDSTATGWTTFPLSNGRDRHVAHRLGHPPDLGTGRPVYLLIASLRL
ncbi:hypothetical protein [Planctomycetes bacterium SV_7m_r]|uniref:hypothetical protein n=1 Tax=Stieleria bergensis TaxID=2528025 RepID=UPI00119DB55B